MARIMVVDDEPSMVTIISRLLGSEDHTITGIVESDRAKELLETEDFDLVISDMRMKPVDGLQLLKAAKKQHPGMPVIMVTAYDSEALSAEAMREGAFAFLPKPFKVNDIIEATHNALNGKN